MKDVLIDNKLWYGSLLANRKNSEKLCLHIRKF